MNHQNHQLIWERKIGWHSDSAPYIFENSFFYGNYDGEARKIHQFDINTGKTIRELDVQSITTQPYFRNSVMYTTASADGGKLVAYDLERNKILWQKNINFGVEVQPVYLKDRIIANAEDDLWFEIDFNGNFINFKSENSAYVDDEKVNARKFHFLSHDHTPITKEWLQKNKLANSEFKTDKNQNYTFLLSDNYLTVIGKKGKLKLQINLETIVPPEEYENEALSSIVSSENEKLWFVFQNHLIHYDVKKEKVLRNVYLINWQPHQLILEGRNIWLISKNDGQLYHLDFEPDEELNRKLQRDKAIAEHLKCDTRDPEKIKAAKEAGKNRWFKMMKMYILIKSNVPDKLVPVITAHASLGCYLKFETNENMKKWIGGIFKKVVCVVNEAEFESFKNKENHIVLTESSLDNREVCIVFCPQEEYRKKFKFLKMWTPQNI